MIPDDGELVVFSRVQIGLNMGLIVNTGDARDDFFVPHILNNQTQLLLDCLVNFFAPKLSELLVENIFLLRLESAVCLCQWVIEEEGAGYQIQGNLFVALFHVLEGIVLESEQLLSV